AEYFAPKKGEKHAELRVEPEAEGGTPKDAEDMGDMSPEAAEKHRKFEQMRKKHYEMRNAVHLLGHPEGLPDEEEDDDDDDDGEGEKPGSPDAALPGQFQRTNRT